MRVNSGKPTNTPVFLLSADKKQLALDGINRIREKDCRDTVNYSAIE